MCYSYVSTWICFTSCGTTRWWALLPIVSQCPALCQSRSCHESWQEQLPPSSSSWIISRSSRAKESTTTCWSKRIWWSFTHSLCTKTQNIGCQFQTNDCSQYAWTKLQDLLLSTWNGNKRNEIWMMGSLTRVLRWSRVILISRAKYWVFWNL